MSDVQCTVRLGAGRAPHPRGVASWGGEHAGVGRQPPGPAVTSGPGAVSLGHGRVLPGHRLRADGLQSLDGCLPRIAPHWPARAPRTAATPAQKQVGAVLGVERSRVVCDVVHRDTA